MREQLSRRTVLKATAGSIMMLAAGKGAAEEVIQGFGDTATNTDTAAVWQPFSDRKLRVGIVGYGVCKFGAAFGFQDHPNVEIVAVSDLIPERCQALAAACRCAKTYPSLEELVKDPNIEAVFVATDAPSHARHCIEVVKHGKHAACAVPAAFGSLEEADDLFEAVKKSGMTYMMFETSAFHDGCFAMRKIYQAGGFGKIIYAEGEYYHYMVPPVDSFNGWRIGLPPQWYPTHSNAYYSCVTGQMFTSVSCVGVPCKIEEFHAENNRYRNPFGTEVALLSTSDGGSARMVVSWDTPGYHGETGRVRGELGSMQGVHFDGLEHIDPDTLKKPPLPPGMDAGGHGGSHGYLCNEFVESILLNRKPLVDITLSLNMTAAGIQSHRSALKDGKLLKIPQWG
jgi:predicted dehydrogenase